MRRKETLLNLRVAIIEDNPSYRRSLETLFAHAAGFAVAASFGSAQAALAEVETILNQHREPDWNLVLMDLDLPGLNGIEATRWLKKNVPQPAIVVLTVFEEPTTILEAISAGADGYLLKKASAPEILAQLRVIVSGGAPLTSGVARTVLDLLRTMRPPTAEQTQLGSPARLELTERELEVLQCLVRGLSYKQAADHLGVSVDTVRTHIRGVYRKLQVHSVAEAVARAIRDRLV